MTDFSELIDVFEKNIIKNWDARADDWTSRTKLARLAAESCAADLFAAAFQYKRESQHSDPETQVGQNFVHNKEEADGRR